MDTNRLITPQEVVDMAFGVVHGVTPDAVKDTVIIAAEQKFIRPVINGLFDKMKNGEYRELLEEYVKPALATYVKLLMLPEMAVSPGRMGIIQTKSGNIIPAGNEQVKALKKAARNEANTLMRRAVEHIERNMEDYPEYVQACNILKRRSIASEIVL